MSKLADRRGFRLNTQAVYSWVSRACAARLYDWAVSPCSTDQPSTNKTTMSYPHIEQDLASPSPAFRPFARPRRLFDALAAKIQAAEKVQTFIEEHIEELKTTQPEGGPPAQSLSNRKRRPRSRKTRQS